MNTCLWKKCRFFPGEVQIAISPSCPWRDGECVKKVLSRRTRKVSVIVITIAAVTFADLVVVFVGVVAFLQLLQNWNLDQELIKMRQKSRMSSDFSAFFTINYCCCCCCEKHLLLVSVEGNAQKIIISSKVRMFCKYLRSKRTSNGL